MRSGWRPLAISGPGFNNDGDVPAVLDDVIPDLYVIAAAGFKPPPFWGDLNSVSPIAGRLVADDFSVAGLDQDAAGAVHAEITVLHQESVAHVVHGADDRPHRQVHLAVKRDGKSLGLRLAHRLLVLFIHALLQQEL